MGTTSTPRRKSEEAYGPIGRSAWLDVDWRTYQHWINVDDQPVNVIEMGSGAPLVFIHGLSGSWQNWLEQVPVFAQEHRVIALDLPGFGHSPMPREKISIRGYASLLDRLFDVLEIDAAAIVGNSMGGFIAAELALAFPQRVERMVLVSPAGISTAKAGAHLPWLRRSERILAASTAWIASKSDTVARRPRLRNATLSVVAVHPSRLPAPLVAEQLRGSGKPGFFDAVEAIVSYPLRDRLPEIVCPSLIVWGDHDPLITVRDAEVFAELIPGSRKVIFEDTGHVAMLERPAAFNELLEGFLGE
jgi:4,5:9,10-diseco-3-hydroxy-5,9,17-trioxoandrosta-1(10),2-diene-4-oate hydrolase